MGTKILIGNNMEKLKEIESESVDCIVSSPPYFGLRDYGTASWEGGDSNCDHKYGRNSRGGLTEKQNSNVGSFGDEAIKHGEKCKKCGAKRTDEQFGLEETLEEYIEKTVLLFEELRRVLKPQGTVWWNIGDSYASKSSAWGGRGKNSILNKTGLEDKQRRNTVVPDGLKAKDLMMIPARVAIALSENGWYLRSEIIWHKPNPMPESVKDRPTSAHEKIYLFAKNKKYYYDADAIRVPQKQDSIARAGRDVWKNNKIDTGNYSIPNVDSAKKLNQKVRDTVSEGKIPMANKRNVWTVTTKPFRGAHFAVFPPDLIEPCIKAGSSEHGCCSECGNPYIRDTKVVSVPQRTTRDNMVGVIPGRNKTSRMNSKEMESLVREERGWVATCKCNADVVKSVVLDPFGGSGTTGLVANNLGRNAILIELNEEYVEIAKKRLGEDLGLFSEVKDG